MGVLQNASGFTETGRRVWGGGQVKVSEREWVAWPLDLLMLHVLRRRAGAQQAIQAAEEARRQREAEKAAEARRPVVSHLLMSLSMLTRKEKRSKSEPNTIPSCCM